MHVSFFICVHVVYVLCFCNMSTYRLNIQRVILHEIQYATTILSVYMYLYVLLCVCNQKTTSDPTKNPSRNPVCDYYLCAFICTVMFVIKRQPQIPRRTQLEIQPLQIPQRIQCVHDYLFMCVYMYCYAFVIEDHFRPHEIPK